MSLNLAATMLESSAILTNNDTNYDQNHNPNHYPANCTIYLASSSADTSQPHVLDLMVNIQFTLSGFTNPNNKNLFMYEIVQNVTPGLFSSDLFTGLPWSYWGYFIVP